MTSYAVEIRVSGEWCRPGLHPRTYRTKGEAERAADVWRRPGSCWVGEEARQVVPVPTRVVALQGQNHAR